MNKLVNTFRIDIDKKILTFINSEIDVFRNTYFGTIANDEGIINLCEHVLGLFQNKQVIEKEISELKDSLIVEGGDTNDNK